MKIQKNKENILITTESAKTLVFYDGKPTIDESIDIVIQKNDKEIITTKAFMIDVPGEYEEKNLMVQAIPSASNREIEILSLDNEGINLIIVDSNTRMPNSKILEQVGINNIMIFKELNGNLGNLYSLIEDFSPEFLIPLCNSKETIDQISKKLSLVIGEAQKTFSITQEELPSDEEDQPMKLIVLE
jgi:hypothetical protein